MSERKGKCAYSSPSPSSSSSYNALNGIICHSPYHHYITLEFTCAYYTWRIDQRVIASRRESSRPSRRRHRLRRASLLLLRIIIIVGKYSWKLALLHRFHVGVVHIIISLDTPRDVHRIWAQNRSFCKRVCVHTYIIYLYTRCPLEI